MMAGTPRSLRSAATKQRKALLLSDVEIRRRGLRPLCLLHGTGLFPELADLILE